MPIKITRSPNRVAYTPLASLTIGLHFSKSSCATIDVLRAHYRPTYGNFGLFRNLPGSLHSLYTEKLALLAMRTPPFPVHTGRPFRREIFHSHKFTAVYLGLHSDEFANIRSQITTDLKDTVIQERLRLRWSSYDTRRWAPQAPQIQIWDAQSDDAADRKFQELSAKYPKGVDNLTATGLSLWSSGPFEPERRQLLEEDITAFPFAGTT